MQGTGPDFRGLGQVELRVGPMGRPRKEGFFFCFLKLLFNAKTIPENPRKCFKAQKNTQKITKIPEKFPKIGWSMNNPSKVFGAHEKDFKAFY
jgi:hypothetical protein